MSVEPLSWSTSEEALKVRNALLNSMSSSGTKSTPLVAAFFHAAFKDELKIHSA